MLGLFGSHRTGKTTLARAYADKHGIPFVETPVSNIFQELGIDPAARQSFSARLDIQDVILTRLDGQYARHAGHEIIVDRTPLDMLGYTLAEALGDNLSDADQARLLAYTQRCYEVLNKRFGVVLLVQPGIPIIDAPGKAAPSPGYIEHLSALMLGLSVDERCKVPHFFIPRKFLSLEDRIFALEDAVNRAGHMALQGASSYRQSGALFH